MKLDAPLIDRQRALYGFAEELESHIEHGTPLRKELTKFLVNALKGIACGHDAEEALGRVCKTHPVDG